MTFHCIINTKDHIGGFVMPRLTRESKIFMGNQEMKVEDALKTVIYLPGEDINLFFHKIGLTIPREIRIYVLKEILRERVAETRKSRLTLADELNYRLSWFAEFTETQLENLLIFYDDVELFKTYLESLWVELLGYLVEKKVSALDMKHLYDQSVAHVRAVGLELPNYKTYNRTIKNLFFDAQGKIDGLSPERIRPVLFKSSTLSEVRDFGTKYDVDVPRRLKKNELADIIVAELKERNKYTLDLEKQIRKMSVILMQRYAIDHDIKASTELKKEEIIEYVLSNAKETKESYYSPESSEVYEKEMEVNESESSDFSTSEQHHGDCRQHGKHNHAQPVDLTELTLELRLLRQTVEKLVQTMVGPNKVVAEEIKEDIIQKEAVVMNVAESYGAATIVTEEIQEVPVVEDEVIEEVVPEEKEVVKEEIVEEIEVVKEVPVQKETPQIVRKNIERPVKPMKVKKSKKKAKKFFNFILLALLGTILFFVFYVIVSHYVPQLIPGFGRWLNLWKVSGTTGLLDYLHQLIF